MLTPAAAGSPAVASAIAASTVLALVATAGAATAAVVVASVLVRRQRRLAAAHAATTCLLDAIVAGADDAIVVVDQAGTVRFASPSLASLTGWPLRVVTGARLAGLLHPADASLLAAAISGGGTSGSDGSGSHGSGSHASGSHASGSDASDGSGDPAVVRPQVRAAVEASGEQERLGLRLAVADGTWRHVEASVGPPVDATHAGSRCRTLVVRDVSEEVAWQRRLEEQARLDPLTGLPNRGWFSQQLAARLDRLGPGSAAVLFVDLDGFKQVNDTAGHAVGDRLLASAARRLVHTLRGDDLVGRLSGDEFAALVTAGSRGDVIAVSRRVREQLAAPYALAGLRLTVGASVGVAFVEGPGSPESLLGAADLAMYEAKRQGGARFAVYEPELLGRRVLAKRPPQSPAPTRPVVASASWIACTTPVRTSHLER